VSGGGIGGSAVPGPGGPGRSTNHPHSEGRPAPRGETKAIWDSMPNATNNTTGGPPKAKPQQGVGIRRGGNVSGRVRGEGGGGGKAGDEGREGGGGTEWRRGGRGVRGEGGK